MPTIKGDGGAVGHTANPSAHRRWMVVAPAVARVIEEFAKVKEIFFNILRILLANT